MYRVTKLFKTAGHDGLFIMVGGKRKQGMVLWQQVKRNWFGSYVAVNEPFYDYEEMFSEK